MLESLNRLGICIHLSGIAIFVNFEVKAIFFEDLQWRLFWQSVEHLIDFSLTTNEYLEFFGEDNIIEFGNLLHKTLQELSTVFDELCVVAVNEMLLWDSWDIATWPSHAKHDTKCIKFAESSRFFELSLVIDSSHSVLEVTACLSWVSDSEF